MLWSLIFYNWLHKELSCTSENQNLTKMTSQIVRIQINSFINNFIQNAFGFIVLFLCLIFGSNYVRPLKIRLIPMHSELQCKLSTAEQNHLVLQLNNLQISARAKILIPKHSLHFFCGVQLLPVLSGRLSQALFYFKV